MLLSGAFETTYLRRSFLEVFLADAAVYTLTPQLEAGGFQCSAHQFYHLFLRKAKLKFYGRKRCTILPRHTDYPIQVSVCHSFHGQRTVQKQECSRMISLSALKTEFSNLVLT